MEAISLSVHTLVVSDADLGDSGSFGLSECKEYGYFAFSKLWKNKRGNEYFLL